MEEPKPKSRIATQTYSSVPHAIYIDVADNEYSAKVESNAPKFGSLSRISKYHYVLEVLIVYDVQEVHEYLMSL